MEYLSSAILSDLAKVEKRLVLGDRGDRHTETTVSESMASFLSEFFGAHQLSGERERAQ